MFLSLIFWMYAVNPVSEGYPHLVLGTYIYIVSLYLIIKTSGVFLLLFPDSPNSHNNN